MADITEPLFRMLRDEGANTALRGVPFAGPLTAKVSAHVDDITVFVSHREEGGFKVRSDRRNQNQF